MFSINTSLVRTTGLLMRRKNAIKKSAGLTLIELLVTIAIMGIAMSIGVPSLNTMVKDNGLSTTYNQMVGLTAYARMHASKRHGENITLCKSVNGTSCSNASSGFKLIVFTDAGTMGSIDGTDVLLKQVAINDTKIKLDISGFNNHRIVFLASGKPEKTGSIMVCDDRSSHIHGLVMNMSGQIRKATAAESSCS